MSWVAAAVAGGSILSSAIGAGAAGSAAGAEIGAGNKAINTLQGMYAGTQGNLQPFVSEGQQASGYLSQLLAPGGQLTQQFGPQQYLANLDPSYGLMQQVGLNTLNAQAGAGSGALSGAAQKGLASWAEDYASTGYENAFNRWQQQNTNTYNRLMGASQLGAQTGSSLGQIGAQYGGQIAGTMTGIGSAQAAGDIGTANAISGGINNMSGYLTMQQLLSQQQNPGGINYIGGTTPAMGYNTLYANPASVGPEQ